MTQLQLQVADVVERAVKSFAQGFLVAWAATNFAMTKVALIGAGMAALSVVWNTTSKLQSTVTSQTPPVVPVAYYNGLM